MQASKPEPEAFPPPTEEKTTCFCPECWHSAPFPPEGDWNRFLTGNNVWYECPECDSVVPFDKMGKTPLSIQ